MTIHREGYPYILIATALLAIIGYVCINVVPWLWLSILIAIPAFLLWLWVVAFFRLPARQFVFDPKKIIAPADGKIVVIEEADEPEYFKAKRLQVSIFMSPLNVHVNRCPMNGTVCYQKYHPGKYLVAWHPKSSTLNERTTVVIDNGNLKILLRQIAGAVARRIACYVKQGDAVQQNGEFGFIRFGSRVDIFLPPGTKVNVNIGDIVKGGITVIAEV
ncbi:MAG: phosphatidylserine decarboxylase family protein [Chitinophagia bacterium]|nr:phosphatidylserine decarboxylase family protein [Chitinophagia bacterium]